MLIKIAKNGIESEWFQLTKKRHRTLLLEKPDAVFVHIDSLYPKSPESGQIVELSFPCFNLLAREFVLEENRQEKQNERHQDYRAMEDINPRENGALMTSLEEIYLRQEIRAIIGNANVRNGGGRPEGYRNATTHRGAAPACFHTRLKNE